MPSSVLLWVIYLSAEVWNALPSTPQHARTALILKQTWAQAASGSNLGSSRKAYNLYFKNVHFRFQKEDLTILRISMIFFNPSIQT
jgi:hypothetical protein